MSIVQYIAAGLLVWCIGSVLLGLLLAAFIDVGSGRDAVDDPANDHPETLGRIIATDDDLIRLYEGGDDYAKATTHGERN